MIQDQKGHFGSIFFGIVDICAIVPISSRNGLPLDCDCAGPCCSTACAFRNFSIHSTCNKRMIRMYLDDRRRCWRLAAGAFRVGNGLYDIFLAVSCYNLGKGGLADVYHVIAPASWFVHCRLWETLHRCMSLSLSSSAQMMQRGWVEDVCNDYKCRASSGIRRENSRMDTHTSRWFTVQYIS